ncbi:MAG TPA: mycothiol system anti-sigma-R factor [Nocardioidaceae bacterium]|nr:mycothiol system anti-sigma-R factor [Nocardioidaceae bacterium]
MSCGKHHETDCSEVLQRVVFFIDNELEQADCAQIQQHLEECGPCLDKFDLERTVKALVARSCSEHAPESLRDKVLLSIRRVQVEMLETRISTERE